MNRRVLFALPRTSSLFRPGLLSGTAAPIASGENQDGTITAGSNQVWTFTAAINDTLLARVGELSGGTPFSPRHSAARA
jgi:hypothetical protein